MIFEGQRPAIHPYPDSIILNWKPTMRPIYPLTITYKWSCSLCQMSLVENDGYSHPAHEVFVSYAAVPPDWHLIDGQLVCPHHKIEIDPT